jgi:tetratricopeptide (TPR) repeat protein
MMEYLPAANADGMAESLRLVDEADIYLGIFARRYGYEPEGYSISITEMEYNRAVERGIPCLIFLMHPSHRLSTEIPEAADGAAKLEQLKGRLGTKHVVNFFESPADLRANVVNSLSQYHNSAPNSFHNIGAIPAPPEPYIAHPYTLLQTKDVVGRRGEFELLTDWVHKSSSEVYQARILNIVSIGGMGKSALTWKWFNDIAPRKMKPLAGRMWWSFYESDARFENFVLRSLAYVTGQANDEAQKPTLSEAQERLLRVLDRRPFLIVLDGLERMLIAYARLDPARIPDEVLDEQTSNSVGSQSFQPVGDAQLFAGNKLLRRAADPRAGAFLRELATVKASRVLVSTRLYPADLQAVTGEPVRGSFAYFLPGLSDDDAIALWRSLGNTGSPEAVLSLFNTFDKHPLLIQALAREVARNRHAPKDFDGWLRHHRDFNPFALDLVQVRSRVLDFALRDLDPNVSVVLQTIAAFRMPATYDTLTALLVGVDKLFAAESALDAALTELEDRGLLGWDRRANRYDLHPIVRGVAWNNVRDADRLNIYSRLERHFESLPSVREDEVESLEDLTPAIELYNTLIGQERYDDAWSLFDERILKPLWFRLSASREQASLLEALLQDKYELLTKRKALFRLANPEAQAGLLDTLASAYHLIGQPGMAESLYKDAASIEGQTGGKDSVVASKEGDAGNQINRTEMTEKHIRIKLSALCHLSAVRRLSGKFRDSIAAAREGLNFAREHGDSVWEATSLRYLGLVLAVLNDVNNSEKALMHALSIYRRLGDEQNQGTTYAFLAQRALWMGEFEAAEGLLKEAWRCAEKKKYKRDFIRVSRLKGAAALGLNDFSKANDQFHHALTVGREAIFVEEELPAIVGLAELRRRQKLLRSANELLSDAWQPAENGPFLLSLVDAYNVLAQIKVDEGDLDLSLEAATKAFRLAWCDGPPFIYHHGLETARKHLSALGAPLPFDLSETNPVSVPIDEGEID